MKRRIAQLLLVVMLVSLCSSAFALGQQDLDEVTARISAVTDRTFEVRVEQNSELNAYADGSNSTITVFSGMLQTLKTKAQLAYVIGHENAHLILGHAKQQMRNVTLGAIGGLLLGLAIKAKPGDIGAIAQNGAALANGHKSRSDEYEADEAGLNMAFEAGFDPEGGAEAMQLLIDRYGRGSAGIPVLGWLASHPDAENRLKRLRDQAAKLEAGLPIEVMPEARPALEPMTRPEPEPEVQQETKPADPVQVPETEAASFTPVVSEAAEFIPVIDQPTTKAFDPNQKFGFEGQREFTLKGIQDLIVTGLPSGTAKIIYRVFGPDGNLVLKGKVKNNTINLYDEHLRAHGSRFQLDVTAFDANGAELETATIEVVV